jgi:hypothetical protein
MKANLRLIFVALLTFLGAFSLGQASVEPYQVVINGHPSRVKVIHEKTALLIPLTLAANQEPEEWTVSLRRDDKAHQVLVTMTSSKRKLRGETDCYWCSSSGLCALDYPAGSGVNFAGASEGNCNGTGICYHCGGTGKL